MGRGDIDADDHTRRDVFYQAPGNRTWSTPTVQHLHPGRVERLVGLHISGPLTILPNEWHKTMLNPLLVFRVSGEVLRKETFFVKEPPEQKRHHSHEHDEPPVRAQRKRRAKKVQ